MANSFATDKPDCRKKVSEIKLGSLFDGSGGFPLAGSLYGITPVWASEVEPYSIAVTRTRFPKMKHLGDIAKINGGGIEPVDIITFGSPCQDLSIAGLQAGLKHKSKGDETTTRSGLFMEAVRIIKEMRDATNGMYPRYVVWENVFGAFGSNKGRDFQTVIEEFIKIKEPEAPTLPTPEKGWAYADCIMGDGWSIAYRTVDAQYWGVPQRRRRICLVADFGGARAPEILFESEGLRGYFEAGRAPWEKTASDVEGSIRTGDIEKCLTYDARGNGDGKTVNTLTGDHNNRITDYTTVICLQDTVDRPAIVYAESGAGHNVSGTLMARDYKGVGRLDTLGSVVCYENNSFGGYTKGVGTLKSSGGDCGGGSETLVVMEQKPQYIVRRLTPTECARLQGFPDDWGHIPQKEKLTDDEYQFWQEVRNTHADINGKQIKDYTKDQILKWYNKLWSDSSEYKMWGNGIALPNAMYVMQGIVNEQGKQARLPEKDE